MSWHEEAKRLRFVEEISWTETSNKIREMFFEDEDFATVHERVRGYLRKQSEYKADSVKQKVVGIIGDTHFPFVHPNYIHFLKETFNKYKVTDIVHIGDMCDNSAISRHQTETCAMDATTEYQKALECVQEYAKVFPKLKYTLGNHSLIPVRQAATLGIPKEFIRGTADLWNFPKGWEVSERFIIDNVLYEHGIGYSSKTGALDKAVNAMQSCVIGHAHAFGGCLFKSNSQHLIFGLNAGCGVSINSYAFNYGKYAKNREILGCGIVFNSSCATFIPMGDKWFKT